MTNKKNRLSKKKRHTQQGRALRMGHVTLSLCMILKNEAHNIAECIHSIRPVIDEIIVVDTGSTDNTREIAKGLGARVFDFPWCDDFSAARNESIRHATGDYIIWLDADDRVDPAEVDKIRQLKAILPRQKNKAYSTVVRSESPLDGNMLFHQMRIFPNIPGAVFEGQIHEQIFQNLKKVGVGYVQTDIMIRHTGYHDAETVARKSARNLRIIQDELKNDPDNPILHFNAARTLAGINKREEAIAHMQQVMENPEIRDHQRGVYLEAALLMGTYYSALGRHDQAGPLFSTLSQEFPENGLLHYCLGETLFRRGDYAEAKEKLQKSLFFPIKVGLFPLNLDKIRFDQLYLLGQCYLKMGKIDLAREMFLKASDGCPGHYKGLETLGLLSLANNDYEGAVEYYERAVQAGGGSDGNYANLGLAYRKLGRCGEAERAFLKALEINPQRVETLANLGHLYLRKKEYEKALDCLTRAQRLAPELADVRLALSEIYFRFHDLENLVQQCDVLLKGLGLPRKITLQSYGDLALLYEKTGDVLSDKGRGDLSLMAYQVSFLIYASAEVLKKIIPLGSASGQLEASMESIKESLGRYAEDPAVMESMREFIGSRSTL